MSLLTYSIKNMIGGVSQQPPSIRLPSQCGEMINCLPSVTDFLKRRPGTESLGKLADVLPDNAFIDFIRRGGKEAGLLIIHGGRAYVYDLAGNPAGSSPNVYFDCENPGKSLRLLTVKDYNFILNTEKTVSGSSIGSQLYEKQGCFVFVKQAAYNTVYTVKIQGRSYSYKTPKDDAGGYSLSSSLIALRLTEKILAGMDGERYGVFMCSKGGLTHGGYYYEAGSPHDIRFCHYLAKGAAVPCGSSLKLVGYLDTAANMHTLDDLYFDKQIEINCVKNIIHITRPYLMSSGVDDSMSGSYIKMFAGTAQNFSDLPLTAPNGYIMEIAGDPSNKYDNYHVEFKTDVSAEAIGEGRWVECPKEGALYSLDKLSMPHVLKATSSGVTAEAVDWASRKAGDDISSPAPSFAGKKLRDIFFYNNRLCFLTEDTVCMSEAGEYFNFFNTTAAVLLDSDPIDVAVSSTKVSPLKYAVPYNEGLFLYSDTALFAAEYGDVLSTANVSVRPVIQFDTELTARPFVADTSIFYTTARGAYSAIREYRPDSSGDLYGYSGDITAHVPSYIPAGIKKITASMEESAVFALTGGKEIYVYNYQNGSGRERIQSAWGKWVFGGKILNMEVINGALYMAVSYFETGDAVYLERITLNGADYNFKDRAGFKDGDFLSSYAYSAQHIRWDGASPAVTAGRVQLRTLTVKYADSGPFKIIIERRGRKPEERFIYPGAGRAGLIAGRQDGGDTQSIEQTGSGEARVAILARNEDVNIRIESIGANQFKLIESRFEAVFTARSRLI